MSYFVVAFIVLLAIWAWVGLQGGAERAIDRLEWDDFSPVGFGAITVVAVLFWPLLLLGLFLWGWVQFFKRFAKPEPEAPARKANPWR